MEFSRLLEIVADEPVFDTGLLLAGAVDPLDVRKQLSRWVAAGRVHMLRRGLYALAPPYQKVKPHPFLVANRMVRGSYVSLQSALAYYGLIPEGVPVTTSVTTRRPGRWQTPLGAYEFRHVKPSLLRGYVLVEVQSGRRAVGAVQSAAEDQRAFVATREKALLDLVYLEPHGDRPDYMAELRLQSLGGLDLAALQRASVESESPKLQRAAAVIARLAHAEAEEYRSL